MARTRWSPPWGARGSNVVQPASTALTWLAAAVLVILAIRTLLQALRRYPTTALAVVQAGRADPGERTRHWSG